MEIHKMLHLSKYLAGASLQKTVHIFFTSFPQVCYSVNYTNVVND